MLEMGADERVQTRLAPVISTDLPAKTRSAGRASGARGCAGALWGFLAAFWRFLGDFFAFLAKSQRPPPPGIEPTTAPIFRRRRDQDTRPLVVLPGDGPRATRVWIRRNNTQFVP